MRPGGLQFVAPENLLAFQAWCHNAHVDFAIVNQEGTSKVYGNASAPVIYGRPWHYRVYFGLAPVEFLQYWADGDQLKIGEALGYPRCCSEFFQKYWVEDGWRDLTYPMFQHDYEANAGLGPIHCNILLRHLGIRPVFHLPCSFDCVATAKVGEEIIEYGKMMGFVLEMEWLEHILNWPVRWSSLHGVAIITTPILKVITSTDASRVCGRIR